MLLNFEPLEKAITQLKKGLEQAALSPKDELGRDGVIQRFEYTMDLSWKLIQRYLKEIVKVDEFTLRTKNDLFREAARLELIDDAEAWMGHYEARNETSTYNAETAQAVFERAKLFLVDVRQLLEKLRNDA